MVLTAVFLFIIMGATDSRAPAGFAPIAIGLGLTLIHLISIPVTNTSVNPARSTGVALFQGSWAINNYGCSGLLLLLVVLLVRYYIVVYHAIKMRNNLSNPLF